ncbi:MAG: hypothetical protein ABSB95_07210 [Dissulfurispiraceae bacterium]|jgi:DNA-directed RNA polymerase specialized sigma24 family protein
MAGPINKSASERLPKTIKALEELEQTIYIGMRLGKSAEQIAGELGLSLEKTKEKISGIRHELIKTGQLYLIEEPQFVSIHSDDPDAQDMPVASGELNLDEKLIIDEFISFLRDAMEEIPAHQTRLLRLRYKHNLSAKDIVGFSNKLGFSLIPDKTLGELKEQDVFYELNLALKGVLKKLKAVYKEDALFGLENLKYIFEEIDL